MDIFDGAHVETARRLDRDEDLRTHRKGASKHGTLLVAAVLLGLSVWPLQHIGAEFMPPMDEGDLLYMPTALPGLSAAKAAELLQQTDRLIKTVPEVHSVYGKAGRADSATDPAPLEMFETTIQFKPRDQWRAGMTPDKLVDELDRTVRVPGLANIWVPPIRNRIDMLATGIKSPVGVKVAGADLAAAHDRERFCRTLERVIRYFELRFKRVTVEMLENTDPTDRTLRFRIDALLHAEPAPEPVVFDSAMEPSTGSVEVNKGR